MINFPKKYKQKERSKMKIYQYIYTIKKSKIQ